MLPQNQFWENVAREVEMSVSRTAFLRSLLGLLVAAIIGVFAATPVLGYGAANWQIGFSGTGPGFGFWGWCDFGGANSFSFNGLPSSGTTGDCQFSEYGHVPGVFSGTCEVSMDLTAESGQPAWQIEQSKFTGFPDFFVSGTAVTHPADQTSFCATLPGSPPPTYSNFDTLLPVKPGHLNASGFFGTTELQIQETVIP
jgi:hypothetical protein